MIGNRIRRKERARFHLAHRNSDSPSNGIESRKPAADVSQFTSTKLWTVVSLTGRSASCKSSSERSRNRPVAIRKPRWIVGCVPKCRLFPIAEVMDMPTDRTNPLTPALRDLLRTSRSLRTTDSKVLAAHLNRSPATIRTAFQRILEAMNVHSRYAALSTAEACGWLQSDSGACAAEMYASAVLMLPDPRSSVKSMSSNMQPADEPPNAVVVGGEPCRS